MAGYKKVILTERKNSLTATTTKVENNSASEFDKFDTNYSNDKLNSIYNEYESIVLNPEKNTLTKNNALVETKTKKQLSFKTKVYIVSATLVVSLLIFLAIFNIFVIKNMNNSIQIVEGNVVEQEHQLNDVIKDYNKLNNVSKWEQELKENGYDVDKALESKLDIIVPLEDGNVAVDANWFDKVCDFLSNIFGG